MIEIAIRWLSYFIYEKTVKYTVFHCALNTYSESTVFLDVKT